MGFGDQLREILCRLPAARQTLLFSATLPKLLVDFARAGLTDPTLVRLDVDTKIPETLRLAFFRCRPAGRQAVLLHLLENVIPREQQAVVFCATRHHVEYLHLLLQVAGVQSTYIYSHLDSTARKINTAKFVAKKCKVRGYEVISFPHHRSFSSLRFFRFSWSPTWLQGGSTCPSWTTSSTTTFLPRPSCLSTGRFSYSHSARLRI